MCDKGSEYVSAQFPFLKPLRNFERKLSLNMVILLVRSFSKFLDKPGEILTR